MRAGMLYFASKTRGCVEFRDFPEQKSKSGAAQGLLIQTPHSARDLKVRRRRVAVKTFKDVSQQCLGSERLVIGRGCLLETEVEGLPLGLRAERRRRMRADRGGAGRRVRAGGAAGHVVAVDHVVPEGEALQEGLGLGGRRGPAVARGRGHALRPVVDHARALGTRHRALGLLLLPGDQQVLQVVCHDL